MKVIRHSVFETNSSSSHVISISGRGECDDQLDVEDGVCKVYGGVFGWGIDTFRDAQTKASYCLTWAMSRGSDYQKRLRAVLAEKMNCEVRFVERTGDYYPWGDIDHQSSDVAAEAFESDENLERFIFNPRSVLVIDHDNH